MKAHMGQSIRCQPSCNDSVNALLEAMCFATQRFGPGFQHFGFMAVLSYGEATVCWVDTVCSVFFDEHFFCDSSNTIIQSYMNHHESHPTVSNTSMTPRLRSLWWFLISANLFQPAGLLHLHQGLRRFSFEEFSQCLGDGGVDRFDDFEWLQTDAATAFLCVSCHVFSTWILSTQNI